MEENIIVRYLLNLLQERIIDFRQLGGILRREFGIKYSEAKKTILPKLLERAKMEKIETLKFL